MSNMNPKGFLCSYLQVAEIFDASNYPKSECCNMTTPPARVGIQSCGGCLYAAHTALLHSSSYYTCIHMHFCRTEIVLSNACCAIAGALMATGCYDSVVQHSFDP